jgi:hypothetical protein
MTIAAAPFVMFTMPVRVPFLATALADAELPVLFGRPGQPKRLMGLSAVMRDSVTVLDAGKRRGSPVQRLSRTRPAKEEPRRECV